jgi:hypothetical protein
MEARKKPDAIAVRARPTRALTPSTRTHLAIPTLAALPLVLSLGCGHDARESASLVGANATQIARDPCVRAPTDAPTDAGSPPAPPPPDPPDMPGTKADVRPRPIVAEALARDGRPRR